MGGIQIPEDRTFGFHKKWEILGGQRDQLFLNNGPYWSFFFLFTSHAIVTTPG
jgi:hypothetical protein